MQINDLGIQLINNKSIVFENTIQKCHEDGIRVTNTHDKHPCCPLIMKNYIESSTHNGIVCEGHKSWPDIRANVIEANRKAGIRLTDNSRAHIGGESFDDLVKKRSHLDSKEHAELYQKMFEDSLGGGNPGDSHMDFYEVIQTTTEFKEQVLKYITTKEVKLGNSIF